MSVPTPGDSPSSGTRPMASAELLRSDMSRENIGLLSEKINGVAVTVLEKRMLATLSPQVQRDMVSQASRRPSVGRG